MMMMRRMSWVEGEEEGESYQGGDSVPKVAIFKLRYHIENIVFCKNKVHHRVCKMILRNIGSFAYACSLLCCGAISCPPNW